jgi:POT family proton-dependent oligopeptide transporter
MAQSLPTDLDDAPNQSESLPPAAGVAPVTDDGVEPKLGFLGTMKTFPRSFWMGCTIEMWERLAYYGVRVVMPIYIAQADEPGGLHFTQADKGTIYAWWFLVGSGLPMITGGLADRYGYKKTMALYATINIIAFTMMANVRSFAGFFAAVMLLALGTSLFKPALQGTLAQSMSKKNSSVGWGLFYWLVNVGGCMGPPFAGLMHAMGWKYVFYGSALVTSLNYLMLFTYPTVDSGADKTKGFFTVARDTFANIFDRKLLAVIAIFSGFWMMIYQLWDFMPNFYADWIDSSSFVSSASWLPKSWLHETARGVQLKQENAININTAIIVLLVVPVSFMVARLRVLTSMTVGVAIAIVGTLVSGTSSTIYALFLGIFLFSCGEMLTGPKKVEYFSLIAPKGKKALYLGYVNIPVAVGPAIGAKIVGALYGTYGEKATLAMRYLAEKTDYVKGKGAWDGNVEHLAEFVGIKRTEAVTTLMSVVGQDAHAVNRLLWDTYKPYQVWYPFAAIGCVSLIGMLIFSHMSKRWKELDV